MSSDKFELFTALSPEECVTRLSAVVNIPPDGYDNLWVGSGCACIVGDVSKVGFSITIRTGGNNMHATAHGRFYAIDGGGTQISGTCGAGAEHRVVGAFAPGCLIFILIPIFVYLAVHIRSGEIRHWSELGEQPYATLLFSCAFPGVLGLIFHLNAGNISMETKFLRGFVAKTLKAHEP